MNKALVLTLSCAVLMMAESAAYAKDYESIADFEAGSERAESVAKNPAVKGIVRALAKQGIGQCALETLSSTVSGTKVLVGFFIEGNISKAVVGVKCRGTQETDEQRYDLVGILGDGGMIIESLQLN